ncbi:MAG: hypothetical protein ACK5QH_04160 [Rubrivivax sp.]
MSEPSTSPAAPWPLLVLQRSDVAQLAREPALAQGRRIYFVDPGLLDEAATGGLRGLEFKPLRVGPDYQAQATTEAFTLATLLDLRLTAERQRLWPGALVQGWDVGLFFLALQRLLLARQLGERIVASFDEPQLAVLRPSAAQQMYFDSCLVTDLVVAQAPQRFVVVGAYDQVRWARADAYDTVFDAAGLRHAMAGGLVSLVSHVPTCFYDRPWLLEQVARRHRFSLDLPSPLWDVPLQRTPLPVLAQGQAPAAALALAQRYAERARAVLADLLGPLMPQPQAAALQLDAWAHRCSWQALNFQALRDGLAGLRPQFLVSDQDVGLNGPIFSVANDLGSAITVSPHSGYPSMAVPHGRNVTVAERAGWGTQARTLLGQAVAMRPVKLQPGPARRPVQRIQRVCLMLNAMQTEGLSYVDAPSLAAFYKPLQAFCQARGVDLVLRAKPGAPALNVLAWLLHTRADDLVGNARKPLHELALESELCVAFGDPTTGVAPFLDAGSLVLQVGPQHWPTDYLVSLPLIHDRVVHSLPMSDGLQQVQRWVDDPAAFVAACQRQNEAYDQRTAQAQDHLL